MTKWQYSKGLHDLGNGCWAYLQPDGSWGYSNAGLIADKGQSLLVDTLFDLKLTREMLDSMRGAVPEAAQIGTLVNTHSNGDHTYGNQLVEGAQIIASRACADEMREQGPPLAAAGIRRKWQQMGVAGAFFQEVMGSVFSAEGVVLTCPTRTFDGQLELYVGQKLVRLVEVGPAHTRGDILVHVPEDRTVFTGDIVFNGGHPVIWAGPVSNWIRACDRMLDWDIETVVPGHGPITDKSGIRALRGYLQYIRAESHKKYQAGLSFETAARDISLDAYADWLDPERVVANVFACYREFGADIAEPDVTEIRAAMGRYYYEKKGRSGKSGAAT